MPWPTLTFQALSAIEPEAWTLVQTMRPTPTLVRLHIDQGYLGRARAMLDALAAERGGEAPPDLEARWATAAEESRRRARVDTWKRLLSRVRRARARGDSGRGAAWAR